MKRSELKNIVKEILSEESYIDLSKAKIGSVRKEPSGITTKLTDIDPETGKLTWDVKYEVDPEILYGKLDDLVKYLSKAEKGSELAQYRDIIKNLKNKTSRLMKKS